MKCKLAQLKNAMIEILESGKRKHEIVSELAELVKRRAGKKYLLCRLAPEYFSRYTFSDNTKRAYASKMSMFAAWAAEKGVRNTDGVTAAVAEAYIRKLFAEKPSAEYDIFVLRRAWDELLPESKNPWRHGLHIRPVEPSSLKSYRRLTAREVCRLSAALEAVAESAPAAADLADAAVFARCYGMRISDIAGLRHSDFWAYRSKKSFSFVPRKTRRRKRRPLEIPLVSATYEVVERRSGNGEWMFPDFRGRYEKGSSYISHMFETVRNKCGVRADASGRASMHSYRTTFITAMDEAGAPQSVTDSITGHAPQSMHGVYSQPSLKVKRRWIEKALGLPPLNEWLRDRRGRAGK